MYVQRVERLEAVDIAVGGFKSIDAVCATGSTVLGGGHLVLPVSPTVSSQLGNLMVTRSSAVTPGSWRVRVEHVGTQPVKVTIEALAVCAEID